MSSQQESFEDSKKGTEEGQTKGTDKKTRGTKTHQDFWKPRLKRRSFKGRDGEVVAIPEWQVRMKHQRREAWFNLETANQAVAAIKARDVYVSLVSVGWDATLARFKPSPLVKAEICTLGEFLDDVLARGHLSERTVRIYATKLRKIVADIAKVDAGARGKAKNAKFDYVNGGREAWLEKVNGRSLAVLNIDSVTAWRNTYVARAVGCF